MRKKEFVAKIATMKNPIIREFYPNDNGELLSTCWIIEDEKNISNKFITPSVKLLYKEYKKHDIDNFYRRESKFREKYYAWFQESVFGLALDKLIIKMYN